MLDVASIYKWMKMFVAFCLTSMFYFPFEFTFLPGRNVKMLMAAFGIALCALIFARERKAYCPKNLIPLFILAMIVSLIGWISMTYNGTIDDAYSGYIASMAVWLSAAFVACSAIKWAHGTISVSLVGHYLIAVCVAQCIESQIIDNVPSVQAIFDTYVNIDQRTLHRINRLYGFGANLDVAGARFSGVLIVLTHLAYNLKENSPKYLFHTYVFAFIIILVLGSMIARTTYVGVILSFLYIIVNPNTWNRDISSNAINKIFGIISVIGIGVILCTYLYNTNPQFRHLLRFAFEGFFNLAERGEYSVASNDKLMTMYVFPDNLKTWIIGDGYFSNPYWSDPNYIWQGQNKRGFYMETDVGYLRFIFYFGVIGLVAFSLFIIHACRTCATLMRKHTIMFLFIMIANFTIWLKVATDIFCIMALFLCCGNMIDPDSEDMLCLEESDEDINTQLLTE